MSSNIIIREAKTEDSDALNRMMHGLNMYEEALVGGRSTDELSAAKHVKYIQENIRDNNGCAFVAETGGRVCGFIFAHEDEEKGYDARADVRRFGYISELYVDETARGLGIASKLMSAAEQHFSESGIKAIQISAFTANTGAIGLYEKLGYTPSYVCLEKKSI